ncbi:MAG: tetraacyldisaccharide 4'-kinase [Sulfurospirillum sp.]|nr:tetraacyldisaccharide 4'-kinase [Sulfurospirillum sp.]MBL0703440.1 tetraacyldisaccharide 4'-kinase [Sulfurospirillum sp.]
MFWVEEYLFHPTSKLQFFLSFLLYPLSIIYSIIVLTKRIFAKKIEPPIPVVSIGNLTIGGSGKTPFLISLAKEYQNIAIVLRGYKRDSKGLHVITKDTPINISGDEAMLYACLLKNATIIVSEDRLKAINYAHKLGCKAVFLDDGFSKSFINKFDILLRPNPEPKFNFTLPSGAYREPKFLYKNADLVLKESIDFTKKVTLNNPTKHMVLVTAISKPQRLNQYLPKNLVKKIYFEDHYMYTKTELENLIKKYNATSILTTQKDMVKMQEFGLPLSVLDLHVEINSKVKNQINDYIVEKRTCL